MATSPNNGLEGPHPYNTSSSYVYTVGTFKVAALLQSDVLNVLAQDPDDPYQLETSYERSIADTIWDYIHHVGVLEANDGSGQIGTCTRIAIDLGIIACHCIEGLNQSELNNLRVTFGRFYDDTRRQTLAGISRNVLGIVFSDQKLDYAVIKLSPCDATIPFPIIDAEAEALNQTALLHHPINETLKVSVNRIVQTTYDRFYDVSFHDSDHGSSGGAYISPDKKLVAIHLGTQRENVNQSLFRHSLPIKRIIAEASPDGILSRIADGRHNIYKPYSARADWPCPDYLLRPYIITEKYNKAKLEKEGYTIEGPPGSTVKYIIDNRQRKHSSNWPQGEPSSDGTKFPLNFTNDDVVELGESIVAAGTLPSRIATQSTGYLVKDFDYNKDNVSRDMYKKLTQGKRINDGKRSIPAEKIRIEYGWKSDTSSWEFHFFPVYPKR